MTEELKPCEYCGANLRLGVDKKTRQMRSYHFLRCEKRPKPEPTAPDPATSYARSIAVALHARHYPEVTQWMPLDDTLGLLTQIDNMTCSLVRAEAAPTVEPVAWAGYDLDGMVEAFDRVIEAHANKNSPFHNPIDADAQMALRILRGFVPAMKAYAAAPPRVAHGIGDKE